MDSMRLSWPVLHLGPASSCFEHLGLGFPYLGRSFSCSCSYFYCCRWHVALLWRFCKNKFYFKKNQTNQHLLGFQRPTLCSVRSQPKQGFRTKEKQKFKSNKKNVRSFMKKLKRVHFQKISLKNSHTYHGHYQDTDESNRTFHFNFLILNVFLVCSNALKQNWTKSSTVDVLYSNSMSTIFSIYFVNI